MGRLRPPLRALLCKVPDLLADDVVFVEPHPHGQHEQDPRRTCSCHPRPLLLARGVGWLAPNIPRNQILSISKVSRLLASYEKTTWTFDDVCCLNSRLPLRGLYVSQISRYCLWTANGGLCQCDGGGGLGTKDSVREQNLCEGTTKRA